MAKITINGISIDPEVHGPELAAAGLSSPTSKDSNYILVQTKSPLDHGQRGQLEALGADILQYVPESTYVCRYLPADLDKIRTLPFVSWANIYLTDFKVSTALRPGNENLQATNLLGAAPFTSLLNDPVKVDVVLHKDVEAANVIDRIAAAAGVSPNNLQKSNRKIRLTVQRRRLGSLAAIDEVQRIEPFIEPKLANNIARGIIGAESVQSSGTLLGSGQLIAIADTGFDKGTTVDVHPAFVGRVLRLYPLGRTGDSSDPDGHGTHVAGSVLGSGVMQDGTLLRGVAPEAKLIFQSVLDSGGTLGGLPVDLHDLFGPPYTDDGARIHTNSWGSASAGSYTSNCGEVDDFIWTHRDCVICFAAGNDGVDSQGKGVVDSGSIGSPAAAKNCIAVGACENNRPNFPFPNAPAQLLLYGNGWPKTFPADPIHSDLVANNIEGMVAFSSRGPTTTGRVRPDVIAPGTSILSTRSRVSTGTGWGISPDPLYFYDGGTSMATPLVAGSAAVVREYLQTNGVADPSAALIKAVLINGADLISGQYSPPEVSNPPDTSQGFGRVDLISSVDPGSKSQVVQFSDEATALDTNQTETMFSGMVSKGIKATLVWTDPSGEALQNDLDLIVRNSTGQEFHGNMSLGSASFDRTNNVEQVLWQLTSPDKLEVSVTCFRATMPQSYALVVCVQN